MDDQFRLQTLRRHLDQLEGVLGACGLQRAAEYARCAQQLEGMVSAGVTVRIEPGFEGEVLLSWQDAGGTWRACTGLDLPDAARDADPAADGKTCNGPLCKGAWKPLSAFNRNSSRPDGRCKWCRKCDGSRVRDYKRRKRAAPD